LKGVNVAEEVQTSRTTPGLYYSLSPSRPVLIKQGRENLKRRFLDALIIIIIII
jgi:hypothetical protein